MKTSGLFLKINNSRSVNSELPLGVYEKVDILNKTNDLKKFNIFAKNVTMKTNLNGRNVLGYDGKSVFTILLGLTPNWVYITTKKSWGKNGKNLH